MDPTIESPDSILMQLSYPILQKLSHCLKSRLRFQNPPMFRLLYHENRRKYNQNKNIDFSFFISYNFVAIYLTFDNFSINPCLISASPIFYYDFNGYVHASLRRQRSCLRQRILEIHRKNTNSVFRVEMVQI